MAKILQLDAIAVQWEPLPEPLSGSTGFLLQWVTSLAGQLYTQAIAQLDVEPQQAAILQLLNAEGALVQARLAERLHINKATMVFLLNALAEKGLVARQANPADKRTLLIRLTPAGQTKAAELVQLHREADKLFFTSLSKEERKALRALLAKLATQPNSVLGGGSDDAGA